MRSLYCPTLVPQLCVRKTERDLEVCHLIIVQPGDNRKQLLPLLKGHPRGSSDEAGAKLLKLSIQRVYYK